MEKYDSTHTEDELMQQLNDLSNDFLSHDVNSYDDHAPICYHDNEPNTSVTSVATPPSLHLHKFVHGPWSLSVDVKTVLRNRPIEQTLILGGIFAPIF